MALKTEGDYRVEVLDMTATPPVWISNALRFDSPEEARAYGSDLASRWTLVSRWRVAKAQGEEWKSLGEAWTFEVR